MKTIMTKNMQVVVRITLGEVAPLVKDLTQANSTPLQNKFWFPTPPHFN